MNKNQIVISIQEKETNFTKKIINLDWKKYLPSKIDLKLINGKNNSKIKLKVFENTYEEKNFEFSAEESDYYLQYASIDEFTKFFQKHHHEIILSNRFYNPDSNFKNNYYRSAIDHFIITKDNSVIGYISGNIQDWGSYYLRYCFIDKAYRGQELFETSANKLIEILQLQGIDRIEAHVSPNNHRQVIRMSKLTFNITGMIATDRWGVLLCFTKYNNPESERVFLNQYCI